MSNQTSIARPYAKALFQHAVSTDSLLKWSFCIQLMGKFMNCDELRSLIKNQTITPVQQADVIFSLVKKANLELPLGVENFIALLTENKRLFILPAIAIQYEALRALQERTLAVTVSTFSPLTASQVQRLTQALSQRLQRLVTLEQVVDQSLLGGAVIRANNLVIDGSVKGQLMKLGATLAA
jgi:F-type H+-transporting ATPase subunit delta